MGRSALAAFLKVARIGQVSWQQAPLGGHPQRPMRVTTKTLSGTDVQVEFGVADGWVARGNVNVSALRVETAARVVVEIGPSSSIKGFELEKGGMILRAAEAHFEQGLLFDSNLGLQIPELFAKEGTLTIAPLVPAKSEKKSSPPSMEPWSKLLDALGGHLNVDLDLEVKIPVVGKRVGVHKFRVPVVDGVINYKKLEGNLATLESAFIDLQHKEDRLVLERDIPLLPFDAKELICWMLDEEGQKLAAQDEVKLRTLIEPVLPAVKKEPDQEKKRVIVGARAQGIDLALALAHCELPFGDGTLRFGTSDAAGVGELKINGEANYKHQTETPSTQLEGSLTDVLIAMETVRMGTSRLSGRMSLGAFREVFIAMERFIPMRMNGLISELRLSEIFWATK